MPRLRPGLFACWGFILLRMPSQAKAKSIGSTCVHAGEDRHGQAGSITTDIAQTAVFVLPKVEDLRQIAQEGKPGYYYTRSGNPTTAAAEKKIAALEGGAGAVVTSSGMSAILAAVLAVCSEGDEIVSMLDVYGGTIKLFDVVLAKLGIRTKWVPYHELHKLGKYCSRKTKLLFLETPTNPTLRCVDLEGLIRTGHSYRATVMVDNTFATPILQRPLEVGADISMHSATKYLGGHSDLTAGAVVARSQELVDRIREMNIATGGTLDPGASYLLLRGLKTLHLRMERGCANARGLVEFLRRHPKIKRVLYPGLAANEGHLFAQKQMSDFGCMFSLEMKGGAKPAERLIDNLKLWYLATSLGGVESTVSYPVLASHVNCTKKQLEMLDVNASMVRFSTGIEGIDDLMADLEQALEKA
jgi:cystathionine beta-lyase/cystathionine gamma-synthase